MRPGTVTVTTRALHTALTTTGAVRQRISVSDSDETLLTTLIATASDRIAKYCQRTWARALYSETFAGYQATTVMLSKPPLVNVTSVSYLGTAVTDYSVQDAEAGFLFRELLWDWTVGIGWNLVDYRIPDGERPSYTATYWGGYLLPSDNLAVTTLSVDSTDQSFNDSASGLPLLTVGDVVTTSGFSTAGNNGTFTVVSRTAAKLVVATGSGLTTEANDPNRVYTLTVQTLPGDVEQAAIETVKTWYAGRSLVGNVAEKAIGDLRIRFAEPTTEMGLPFTAVALLDPWRRFEVAA